MADSKIKEKTKTKTKDKIVDFCLDWDDRPFWRVLVLYEDGRLCEVINCNGNTIKLQQQIDGKIA
jgi:hypothetical protein